MKTAASGGLHSVEVNPLQLILNRAFALIYLFAILSLFYNHTLKLLNSTNTLISFSVSISLLISDLILAFMWSTTQSFRMRPQTRKQCPEKIIKNFSDKINNFPALDIFICTADPYKEPPLNVVNTALSVMAYDYNPIEKISVYVSDDGGSELTLFAFMEAAKFAVYWLPYCRENKIIERCPDAYFSSNYTENSETQKVKLMYENMKTRIENVIERGKVDEDYINNEEELQAFTKFWTVGFTRHNHPSIIQVLLESGKDKDLITSHGMPNLIYLSREKNKSSQHHFKAGALNALLRVSGIMTNAPIILTLDCDMYSNDPSTPQRALCYFLDQTLWPNLAYVQFPQTFHGLNEADIYASESLFHINPMGMDGFDGPNYFGTGCFFRRRAFFGSPLSFEQPEIPELLPDHVVNKPIKAQEILQRAHYVASCNYESESNWGSKVSDSWFFLYVFMFLGAYGQDCLIFMSYQGTFKRWWNDQRMWIIRGLTSFPFGTIEYLTTHLGISTQGFNVTSKVVDNDQGKRYHQGIFEFGVVSPMFVTLATTSIINLAAFLKSLAQIFRGDQNLDELFIQMFIAGFVVINCWPIYEGMVLRSDTGRMPTRVTIFSTFLAGTLYMAFAFLLSVNSKFVLFYYYYYYF